MISAGKHPTLRTHRLTASRVDWIGRELRARRRAERRPPGSWSSRRSVLRVGVATDRPAEFEPIQIDRQVDRPLRRSPTAE